MRRKDKITIKRLDQCTPKPVHKHRSGQTTPKRRSLPTSKCSQTKQKNARAGSIGFGVCCDMYEVDVFPKQKGNVAMKSMDPMWPKWALPTAPAPDNLTFLVRSCSIDVALRR
jgi:hypothetical protein